MNVDKKTETVLLKELSLPGDLKKLDTQQCRELCKEIRSVLIKTVSKNGGHLASNLGVVELTLAIHRVFSSPDDKIVWDVGHQSYTHKLLTGRYNIFGTLRQENGISGFPKPEESEHDAFVSGHSSTSVSVACAIADAMKLQNKKNHAIAVIGDGAFTGGLAYEGLNNAGKHNTNLIVILNHNDMSISKNVGAFAKYLTTVRSTQKYVNTKIAVEHMLKKTPVVGTPISKAISASKTALRGMVLKGNTMFEDLGFLYLGPVNGHDITELEEVLVLARSLERPVLVHVNTIKGKGYPPAEKNPGEYHGISRFDVVTGNSEVITSDSFSYIFGHELVKISENNEKICAVTAAMKYGTGLQFFAERFRDRFYDVGIAEQHAVTYSAGLASMGLVPVFAVYSSFLQRAYDQLVHDAALSKVHMVIGIDRAGFVGEDGETHQGIFDVPMLTSIPDVTVFSPSSFDELRISLRKAINDHDGLVCVRYPRGSENIAEDNIEVQGDYYLCKNYEKDNLIISYGRISSYLPSVCKELEKDGILCDWLRLVKIFPINEKCIEKSFAYKNIFFFEEGMKNGGIAEHFMMQMYSLGYKGKITIVAPDGFIKQASVKSQLQKYHLDRDGMIETVKITLFGVEE